MTLKECKLCGKIFSAGKMRICLDCLKRLEELDGYIHEYLRDNDDEAFDVDKLAKRLDINPMDIQELIELGYLERDLQTYGRDRKASRQDLADAFNQELTKMRKKVITYGGEKYARDKRGDTDARQYVYDSQTRFRR